MEAQVILLIKNWELSQLNVAVGDDRIKLFGVGIHGGKKNQMMGGFCFEVMLKRWKERTKR